MASRSRRPIWAPMTTSRRKTLGGGGGGLDLITYGSSYKELYSKLKILTPDR